VIQKIGSQFRHWLQDEFRSERLLPGLISGVLIGITKVIVALSLGSLIFSGDLASHLSYGIGTALVTAAVTMIGLSLSSAVSLAEMKEKEPELAATFHEFVVRLLSERLSAANRSLEAVLR
jgi:hypothetical protein